MNCGYSDSCSWQTCSQKWMKWACCFMKCNWQCLLLMIEFKLSSENWNFGKLVSVTVSLIAYQHLKIFLVRLVINKCDFFPILCNEMCQYLGKLHNSWHHYFPNDATKSWVGERSIQSVRQTSTFLCSSLLYDFRFSLQPTFKKL